MDFNSRCACDMAMANDFVNDMHEFVNCNPGKKIRVKPRTFIPRITAEEIHTAKTKNLGKAQVFE